MTRLTIPAIATALCISCVSVPATAKDIVLEPVACAQLYSRDFCDANARAQTPIVRQKTGTRYVDNYGWAEIEALRAFVRMR